MQSPEIKRAHVSERSTHDDRLIIVLLVIVENLLHRLDTRIFISLIVLPGVLLVPIKYLQKFN